MMLDDFQRVWIVGASSGIGLSLAQILDCHGRDLFLSARSEKQLDSFAEKSRSNTTSLPVDVTDERAVSIAAQEIEQRAGALDLLIVNAGTCEYIDGPDIDSALVHRVLDTNFLGAVSVIQAALPLLRQSAKHGKRPKLAVMSSSVTYQALPRAHAYGASKAALRYFTECLKIDLQREGIDVHIISPGFVKTPLTDLNDFDMPFLISSEEAARRILNGLEENRFDIHFPKRFTLALKMMGSLPHWIKYKLLEGMSRSSGAHIVPGKTP